MVRNTSHSYCKEKGGRGRLKIPRGVGAAAAFCRSNYTARVSEKNEPRGYETIFHKQNSERPAIIFNFSFSDDFEFAYLSKKK